MKPKKQVQADKSAEDLQKELQIKLEAEAKKQADAFLKEYNELVKKHKCQLSPVFKITSKETKGSLEIVHIK